MMVVPDIFFLILPFLCIIVAVVSFDARLSIAMYMLGAVSAFLGVAFPYLSSAAADDYWFGIMYVGIGMVSAVMTFLTISDYKPPRR